MPNGPSESTQNANYIANISIGKVDSVTLIIIIIIIALIIFAVIFRKQLFSFRKKNTPLQEISGIELSQDSEILALKNGKHILFIDDKKFKKLENLKKNGWNVKYLPDLGSVHDSLVKEADIIFVDYQGVGRNFGGNGENIITALKNEYGLKKWVVLYSGNKYDLNISRNTKADSTIGKAASPYDFEQEIIQGLKNI